MDIEIEGEILKKVKKLVPIILTISIIMSSLGFQFVSTEIQKAFAEPSYRIVGTFPWWQSEKIDSIEYSKLTDILYFHVYPNADGTLDTSQVNFDDLNKIKNIAHSAGVNVLIVIGGWQASDGFPPIARDPVLREKFVENVESFIAKHNLDGIDIDWETTINKEKIDNQDILLSDLADKLRPQGKLISTSVLGNQVELKSNATNNVDWVNVMAYNMDNGIGHHSNFDDSISTLHEYGKVGIPKEKLVLGIPFYGRNETGDEMGYDEIVSECSPGPSEEYCKGYFFNGIDSIKQKSQHVFYNEYGGLMIWNIAHDTEDQTSLLNVISEVFPKKPLPEKSNPVITEIKQTSKGIVIFWTQEKGIAQSYDIFIDGLDTDDQYRTESSPQLVDYGACFIVQARYPDVDLLSTEICLEPEPTPEPEPESGQKIPVWVKNIMGWYADGSIAEHEIISAIQFLIKEGIIKLD